MTCTEAVCANRTEGGGEAIAQGGQEVRDDLMFWSQRHQQLAVRGQVGAWLMLRERERVRWESRGERGKGEGGRGVA